MKIRRRDNELTTLRNENAKLEKENRRLESRLVEMREGIAGMLRLLSSIPEIGYRYKLKLIEMAKEIEA